MRTGAILLALASGAWAQSTGTVEGTVTYTDRTYGSTGFTGTATRNVRRARIEIIRVSDSAVLGTDFTDDSGAYSIAGVPKSDTEDLFLRAYADAEPALFSISVRDQPSTNAILTATGSNFKYLTTEGSPKTGVNLSITNLSVAGAFNIFDMGVWAIQYLKDSLLESLASVPALTFYWFDSSGNGTFFSRTSNAVFLLGLASDPDQYDDDVILHEVGHWVAHNLSKDDSPGGSHTISGKFDLRLAWSEGWAHYWSSTVRRFAGSVLYPDPDGFVDNFGSGNSYFDIDTPSLSSETKTAQNEVAVANGLWRLTQTVAGLEDDVWLSVKGIKTNNRAQVSLEDFRLEYEIQIGSELAANYLSAFSETGPVGTFTAREIRYYRDSNDSPQDNVQPGVTPGAFPFTTTTRTLFSAGDQDWFTVVIPAGVLNVETSNLKDGADTVLELFDSGGTLLATNDDRVVGDNSSQINIQIQAPGTFRIRVTAFAGSGAIAEHGYYDLKIETQSNAIPVIDSVSAEPTSGNAPLRVAFSVSARDTDGSIHSYSWDFDGDGFYDYVSLEGGNVTHTYNQPGNYVARLRVLDNGDRSSFASVEISVSGPTPTVTMTASFTSLLAPATVTYTIDVSGVVPVAWEWDFEGDGFLDAASSTTNSATTTYRVAAAFIARGFVVDREGRRFRTNGASLIISPGVAPPTITSPLSATATSGSLPFRTNFSVTATGATKFEWDFDGDGRYDQDTGSSSSVVHQYERVGTVTATVRATNASGTSVTSTLGISVTQPATAGWLVEPRRGERITGTSVSLFAEVVPRGRMKKVQFQFRRDGSSDPWSDIGGAVYSEGTRFSTNWNVSAFTELSAFDLRILIDDSVSSGDDDNQVTISASPFDISESGNGKDRLLSASLTTFLRNSAGVEAVVPYESMTSGTTAILRLEPGATFPPNGSTLGGTQFGSSFRLSVVSGSATFRNSIIVRLPIPSGSASSLFEVHRYDEAAGVWRKDEASDVRASEGLVETRTTGLGVFAIFRVSDDGGEDGSNFCFASATHRRAPIPVLFGFLCFIFWRLWRSWRSSSRPAGSSPAKRS